MSQYANFGNIEPVAGDLRKIVESAREQDEYRTTKDGIFGSGIVNSKNSYLQNGSSVNTIKVTPFIAYAPNGKRIEITTTQDNLAPDATDKISLVSGGVWVNSIHYIIVARYAETLSDAVSNPLDSGDITYTRINESYSLKALRRSGSTIDNFENTDVKIGRVDVDGSGNITITINQKDANESFQDTEYLYIDFNRVFGNISTYSVVAYGLGENVTLTDHVSSRGTGTISKSNPHGLTLADLGTTNLEVNNTLYQQENTSNSVIANNYNAMSYSIVPGTIEKLQIQQLITGDVSSGGQRIYINGNRNIAIKGDGITVLGTESDSALTVQFDATLISGTYYIIVSSTGTVSRETNAPTSNANMLIYSVYFNQGTGVLSNVTNYIRYNTMSASNLRQELVNGILGGLPLLTRNSSIYYNSNGDISRITTGVAGSIGYGEISLFYGQGITQTDLLTGISAIYGNCILRSNIVYADSIPTFDSKISVIQDTLS